jgi:hypothetical protein
VSPDLIRVVIGASATALGGLTYVFYFRSIAKGLTKPHAISWGLWAVLDGVAFFGMRQAHAGPAIWLVGSTAVLCAITCVVGIWQRQVRIDRGDWSTLVGASIALGLMVTLPSPLLAVIAGQITGSSGYIPTARKVIRHPDSEDLPTYVTAVAKYALQIGALAAFNYIALSGPIIAVVDSSLMIGLIWWMRRKVRGEEERQAAVLQAAQRAWDLAHPTPYLASWIGSVMATGSRCTASSHRPRPVVYGDAATCLLMSHAGHQPIGV